LAELAVLQEILGVSFKDLSLLEQALVHSSYINENPDFAPTSNERLGRRKPVNLAGALEAVIAAIFLDQGSATAKNFILRLLNKELQKVVSQGAGVDYKSQLQELIQAREQQTPAYYVIEATGPDHDRRFTVEVRAGDTVLGRGSGKSKKEAETEAARSALERL